MPKRTTQTYSSEDAPDNAEKIYVYYCRYCGEHAFITDALLESMPQRKTDRARVIDTAEHHVKLKVTPGAVKYLKRGDGKVEKQFRYNCGALPVLYKSEEHGRYIYVMEDAVSSYASAEDIPVETKGEVPVPPCIQTNKDGKVQIGIDIEDASPRVGIVRINADEVGVEVTSTTSKTQEFQEELLEYVGKVLKLRITQLQIQRGWSNRSRLLICQDITPKEAYERLYYAMVETKKNTIAAALQQDKKTAREEQEQITKLPIIGLNCR
uniref:STEEP1 domain-containing protein n=1 Tax=Pyramimonas obovata TaxID=1411642 RepID=A0A7S0WPZ2_9CHLO|mmetsp:Transcript_33956/g.74287  ORF Transcript_33956/g.74287 Transcript_33956/m.74287 type:complete len:267 (+) Transcript_33956:253-1053(+)|eukprot:CAMPEP_0118942834 /NCGR_PEP_ID=MMETSP1169-20130426/36944_1 /TAXON_ID=36882 /ORGANISM="Pyramimonas obovata, Strain CCMP722" /LENGTH=266 /DNA_ID=CAMNT_0006887921 /DNA_START=255 /DNA_END=1055 /DNA_ORIENTATION=-